MHFPPLKKYDYPGKNCMNVRTDHHITQQEEKEDKASIGFQSIRNMIEQAFTMVETLK